MRGVGVRPLGGRGRYMDTFSALVPALYAVPRTYYVSAEAYSFKVCFAFRYSSQSISCSSAITIMTQLLHSTLVWIYVAITLSYISYKVCRAINPLIPRLIDIADPKSLPHTSSAHPGTMACPLGQLAIEVGSAWWRTSRLYPCTSPTIRTNCAHCT